MEAGAIARMTGKPKNRKDTPSPKVTTSVTLSRMNSGSWFAVGAGMCGSGDQKPPKGALGLSTNAITANTAVNKPNLIQLTDAEGS